MRANGMQLDGQKPKHAWGASSRDSGSDGSDSMQDMNMNTMSSHSSLLETLKSIHLKVDSCLAGINSLQSASLSSPSVCAEKGMTGLLTSSSSCLSNVLLPPPSQPTRKLSAPSVAASRTGSKTMSASTSFAGDILPENSLSADPLDTHWNAARAVGYSSQRSSDYPNTSVSVTSLPPPCLASGQAKQMDAFAALQNRYRRSRMATMVWTTLNDRESSRLAGWYSRITVFITLLAVAWTLQQTSWQPVTNTWIAQIVEAVFETFFLAEFLARCYTAPNLRTAVTDPYNLIDLVALLPLLVRILCFLGVLTSGLGFESAATDGQYFAVDYLLVCVVPGIRLLKTLRNFTNFTLLLSAFQNVFEALPVLFFSMAVISVLFSGLLFVCESDNPGFQYYSDALWFAIVTMSTVGYGDIVPLSRMGRNVTMCLMVVGTLYMAMPIGIIGNSFTISWSDRRAILLMRSTRNWLLQWGYTARDIPVLFSCFSSDAELGYRQFHSMITAMGLGYTDGMILELFEFCDKSKHGIVGAAEFIKAIFPEMYLDVCGGGGDGDTEAVPVKSSGSKLSRANSNLSAMNLSALGGMMNISELSA